MENRKPKVLIAIADAGHGHRSAADAIASSFSKLYPDQYDVKVMDIFAYADVQPFSNTGAMHALISQNYAIEAVINFLMRLGNIPFFFEIFTAYMNWFEYREVKKIIQKEKPDLVVCIHPLVAMVLKAIKRRNGGFKYAVVVTDLVTLFRGWADKSAEVVFCPTEEAVSTLVKYGVQPERIVYPLFPIKGELKDFKPREEILAKHGLDTQRTTIMITGGGVGTRSMVKGIDKLIKNKDLQFIIFAGRSEAIKEKLIDRYGSYDNVRVTGFVTNFQDYLNACDIMVGKPGPATILEVELFGKKAVLTRKVGHQETGNISYALRNPKFRYIGDNWGSLPSAVKELLRIQVQSSRLTSRRRFDECDEIVRDLVKMI